jgi:hypothetical protein
MKTLSVRQPEAWLIVHGLKDVENRSWATAHRGPILIHASAAKMTAANWLFLRETCADYDLPAPSSSDVHTGGIVGSAYLADILVESESEWWDGESLAWLLPYSLPIAFIPCKGRLGLWEHPAPDGVDFSIPVLSGGA